MKRTITRAATVAVVVSFGIVWVRAAEPEWVRDAGLDIWNTNELEAVIRDQEVRAERLAGGFDQSWHRAQVNEQVTHDLADGRLTLAEAAARLWEVNRDLPGFAFSIEVRFRCPTPVEGCARLLLWRVEQSESVPAAARVAALARLRAEYVVEFGHPAPPSAAIVAT